MTEKEQNSQKEPEHKWRIREGYTPSYRAFHEVYITKDLDPERNEELMSFIDKHIAEYKGKTEEKHGSLKCSLIVNKMPRNSQTRSVRKSIFRKNTSRSKRGNIRASRF